MATEKIDHSDKDQENGEETKAKRTRKPRLLTWDVLQTWLVDNTDKRGTIDYEAVGKEVEELLAKKPVPGAAIKQLPTVSEKQIASIAPSIVEAYAKKEDKHTIGEGEETKVIHGVRKNVLLDYLETKAEILEEDFDRDQTTAVLNTIAKQTGRGLGVIVSLPDAVLKQYAKKARR